MRNEKFRDADYLSLPVPAGKKSGDPVRIGALNGVCATDRSTTANPAGGNVDGNASVWLKGGYTFEGIAFAVANIGDPVYILADGSGLTGTATGNSLYGHALTTKAAAAGPLTVRIAN